jgi:CRISPR-associated DxTHG motif protein
MGLIVLSTVGARDYAPTQYAYEDGTIFDAKSSHFVPTLVKYLKATKVIALLTPEAALLQWDSKGLQKELEEIGDLELVGVPIPIGAKAEEYWEIFDKIADAVPKDSDVVLDVTHGLRSLPMIMLTAASYLQQSRNVRIKGVYYGAFEAVERDVQPKPVFNIGPFMTLLDWNSAVDAFKRTGECRPLADLLKQTQISLQKNRSAGDAAPTHLITVSTWLNTLSAALDLVRPHEVMTSAFILQRELKDAENEFPKWAKPFQILLETVRENFADLALANPDDPKNLDALLNCQWQLIRWYQRYNRYSAAVLLAREWIISWYMRHKGMTLGNIMDTSQRDNNSNELYAIVQSDSAVSGQLESVAIGFRNIIDFRNDLAHAGMRASASKAGDLRTSISKAIDAVAKATGQQP